MGDWDELADIEMNLSADPLAGKNPPSARFMRANRKRIEARNNRLMGRQNNKGGETRRASCVKVTMPKINLDDC